MQRVCAVPGGVNAYIRNPDCLVTDETRVCPFCDDGHSLNRHGSYQRWALQPDPEEDRKILVHRLLCVRTGRTLSLLPDFCLPRRQHGPAILGLFLMALVFSGKSFLEALRSVRRAAPGHSVAQGLCNGFLSRAVRIRDYLAGIRPHILDPPRLVPRRHQELALLVLGIVWRSSNPARAFVHHACRFHRQFDVGLA